MNKKAFFFLMTGLLLFFVAGCKDSAPQEKPVVVKKSVGKTTTTAPKPEVQKTETATPASDAKNAAATEAPAPVTKASPTPDSEKPAPQMQEKTASAAKTQAPAAEEKAEPTPETAQAPSPAADEKDDKEMAAAPVGETTDAAENQEGEQPAKTETVSLKNVFLDSDTAPRYDPTGKVDPFATLFPNKSEEATDTSKPKRALTPLEKIDLSQFKLVAVMRAKSGNQAMVVDATGKPYVLSPGTYIGVNSGIVTSILEGRVIVKETTKDFLGRETSSTRELKIQKPLGEE